MLRSILIIASFLSSSFVLSGQIQVSEPNPVVRKLTLSNVHAVTQPEQQRIVRDVLHQIGTQSYANKSDFFDEIANRIRAEFQNRGYFKVLVEDPVVKVLSRRGAHEIVDVDLMVQEGEQYRLKSLEFKNSATFRIAELRAAFQIADGDIFNRSKIASGLENLRRLYGTEGYVNFAAVPETSIDEDAHLVSLSVDLDAGYVFRLGTLTVLGEESEPGARQKLLATWRGYEGKVYDFRLLQQFLNDLGARPNVKPEQIFEISQDPTGNVVNVSMTLVKPLSF